MFRAELGTARQSLAAGIRRRRGHSDERAWPSVERAMLLDGRVLIADLGLRGEPIGRSVVGMVRLEGATLSPVLGPYASLLIGLSHRGSPDAQLKAALIALPPLEGTQLLLRLMGLPGVDPPDGYHPMLDEEQLFEPVPLMLRTFEAVPSSVPKEIFDQVLDPESIPVVTASIDEGNPHTAALETRFAGLPTPSAELYADLKAAVQDGGMPSPEKASMLYRYLEGVREVALLTFGPREERYLDGDGEAHERLEQGKEYLGRVIDLRASFGDNYLLARDALAFLELIERRSDMLLLLRPAATLPPYLREVGHAVPLLSSLDRQEAVARVKGYLELFEALPSGWAMLSR